MDYSNMAVGDFFELDGVQCKLVEKKTDSEGKVIGVSYQEV